jgi:hypothetical protein
MSYLNEFLHHRNVPWVFTLKLKNGGSISAKGRGMIRFRIAIRKTKKIQKDDA